MSVLIKGVKMPKGEKEGLFIAIHDGKAYRVGTKEKLEAVEVPTPHGRLIDELEARKSIKPFDAEVDDDICTIGTAKRLCHTLLDKQPTVIEAEVEE